MPTKKKGLKALGETIAKAAKRAPKPPKMSDDLIEGPVCVKCGKGFKEGQRKMRDVNAMFWHGECKGN